MENRLVEVVTLLGHDQTQKPQQPDPHNTDVCGQHGDEPTPACYQKIENIRTASI